MKKYFKYICALALVAMASMSLSSCSEDSLGPTIFPDVSEEIDPNSYTYKFDKWLKDNYLDVYNLEFLYKFEDVGTDMNYNLEPARLSNSIDLAVLTKYLWFDAYESVSGSKEFVKAYGPRIIMLIGSAAINPTTHTEILGLAEGGIKVSLFKVNEMDEFMKLDDMDETMKQLNKYYFKTMHHEFAHILHQRKSIPHEFQIISTGHYDAQNWQSRPDGYVNSLGFVTAYGSSEIREDFAEIIANYITMTQEQLDTVRINAQRGWEKVVEKDEYGQEYDAYYCFYCYFNNEPGEGNFKGVPENEIDTLEDGTLIFHHYKKGKGKITTEDAKHYYDEDGNLCDEEGYLLVGPKDKEVRVPMDLFVYPVEDYDEVDGLAVLEQKLTIARTWFKEQWGLDLDKLREEVQYRQLNLNLPELRKQVTD